MVGNGCQPFKGWQPCYKQKRQPNQAAAFLLISEGIILAQSNPFEGNNF